MGIPTLGRKLYQCVTVNGISRENCLVFFRGGGVAGGGGVANKVSNVKYFIDHFTRINALLAYSAITSSTHRVGGPTQGTGDTVPTRVPSREPALGREFILSLSSTLYVLMGNILLETLSPVTLAGPCK